VDQTELNELLADAEAYFGVGEVNAAADVLLEGLDRYGPASAAAEQIYASLGGICCSFWGNQEITEGKLVTTRVVDEVAKRLGLVVDAAFKDMYVTACVATGSSPFPINRLFRHQNLVEIFLGVPREVKGDIAECGCARGLSSLELCLAARTVDPAWKGDGFHIFDSFEGLSEPTEKDRKFDASGTHGALLAANMAAGRYAFPLELVARNLHRDFPHVRLHPGWIPEIFSEQPDLTYRFVHIDVDLYQPTIDSLRYFFPRLAAGGVIITDDYNWPGAKAAFDEFCGEQRLELFATETSQAFFRKSAGGTPRGA
jgi:O-methyltransferase